jgi:predicted acyltransferase
MANTKMRQITGIVLLAAGLGWAGANFTPSDATWWNYFLHTIPFLILLVLSLGFFHVADAPQRDRSNGNWAKVALSIFAAFTFTALFVGMILGATNSDPNAYGIKTLADFVPAIIIMLGSLVWLTTLIPSHRGNAEASTVSNA